MSRIGSPSTSSEANASASAWPQSIPPVVDASAAALELVVRASGAAVKPSGTASSCSFSSRSASAAARARASGEVARLLRRGASRRAPRRPRGPLRAPRRACPVTALAHLGDVVLGHDALVDQPPRIERRHRRVLLDALVHAAAGCRRARRPRCGPSGGSRRGRSDVALEALAERHRQADRGAAGLEVVGVDVDDRDVEALGQVRRVRVERASVGSVVKPTWLFAIRCSVPPTE